jgi:hypothetical protein
MLAELLQYLAQASLFRAHRVSFGWRACAANRPQTLILRAPAEISNATV